MNISDPKCQKSLKCRTAYKTLKTPVPALAGEGEVKGAVHYRVFRGLTPGKRKIRTCVLQHGYGLKQSQLKLPRLTLINLYRGYFGPELIQALTKDICGEVILTLQESNATTILEMTRRTEYFIKQLACTPQRVLPGIRAKETCAYIGHSKGGAVAFNIARRCMQKTSTMGRDVCRSLSEIYSATGIIQGSLATVVAYGAYVRKELGTQKRFTKALGLGLNLAWDVYSPYIPEKTNPAWLDLSPSAPMENGVPLFVVNNIALEKKGWLRADFAASASRFRFTGKKNETQYGCGKKNRAKSKKSSGDLLHYVGCRIFGKGSHVLFSDKLRNSFKEGLATIRKNKLFMNPRTGNWDYLKFVSWKRYRQSDGLADYFLALNACKIGLAHRKKPAVVSCYTFKEMNHLGGAGSPESLRDIVKQLRN